MDAWYSSTDSPFENDLRCNAIRFLSPSNRFSNSTCRPTSQRYPEQDQFPGTVQPPHPLTTDIRRHGSDSSKTLIYLVVVRSTGPWPLLLVCIFLVPREG